MHEVYDNRCFASAGQKGCELQFVNEQRDAGALQGMDLELLFRLTTSRGVVCERVPSHWALLASEVGDDVIRIFASILAHLWGVS